MLADLEGMKRFAEALAAQARPGDVLALKGEVGAGKTTFAQSFIGSLTGFRETITSPTFNLVQHYIAGNGMPIVHADLYRLTHEDEIEETGLASGFERAVTLIEWPEIMETRLPRDTLHITLTHKAEDSRGIMLYSASERWKNFIEAVK